MKYVKATEKVTVMDENGMQLAKGLVTHDIGPFGVIMNTMTRKNYVVKKVKKNNVIICFPCVPEYLQFALKKGLTCGLIV